MLNIKDVPIIILKTPQSDRFKPLFATLTTRFEFNVFIQESTMAKTNEDLLSLNIPFESKQFRIVNNRDLLPQEIACAYSHFQARKFLSETNLGGVILEDDARIIDLNLFVHQTLRFLSKMKGTSSILDLYGSELYKYRLRDNPEQSPKFMRLYKHSSRTVANVITKQAARNLFMSQTVITSVADWPNSKSNFYVSIYPSVNHGDTFTWSSENNISAVRKIDAKSFNKFRLFSLYNYIFNFRSIALSEYLNLVFITRLAWKLNLIRRKLNLFRKY